MKRIVSLLLFLLASLATFAHGVQVAYTVMPNGFVRIYVEHWHGALSAASLVNNGMNITTTYGANIITQNLDATGAINNTLINNLPKGSNGIIALGGCAGQMNVNNNWAYYDFAPAAFGVQVLITLNSGNTVILESACTGLYPKTISATFTDTSPPTITCPTPTATVACGESGTNVSFVATATDNAGMASIVYSMAPGSFFPVGTTNVTATATDINGYQSSCTFPVTVSVIDNVQPSITCPANIIVGNDHGKCGASVPISAATATDNCSTPIVVGMRSDGLALTNDYPRGMTSITWTATDASGNKASCVQSVTVNDTQNPTLTCPANQAINLDAACNAPLPDYRNLLIANDNCTPSVNLTVAQSPAAGTQINTKGALIVTFTVTDGFNNTATCNFSLEKKDVTPPVVTCPANMVVNNANNQCSSGVNFNRPTATDNCSVGAFNFFNPGEPNNAGGEDYLQLYNNGYWNDLPNGANNRSIVEFNAIINTSFPNYTYIGVFGGHTYYVSTLYRPWNDSRTAALSIGGDLASINTLEESQYLAPYGGSTWVGGYQDKTDANYVEPGNAGQNFGGWKWVDGTRLGSGQIIITQISGRLPNTSYPIGLTTNVFQATDETGNTSTCSFTVTVRDVQPPTINCPTNIVVNATSAQGSTVNYVTPVGTDNCSGVNTLMTAGFASGALFPIGSTLVTYKAIDASNVSVQCSFTVQVKAVAPSIVCPQKIQVNTAPDQCGNNVVFSATETTAVPASTISYSLPSGSFFPTGITAVTATATNPISTSTCTFNVEVIDNQAPNAVAQNLTVYLNSNGTASLTPAQINNGSTDNCGEPTLTISPSSLDCSHVGGESSAGNAMNFNGNYVEVPNHASLNPLNEWTLETWVKVNSTGVQQGLIEKYDCGSNYGFLLRVTSSNRLMVGVTDGCSFGGAFVTGNTDISKDKWYHVSATFNRAGNVKLYVNGVLDGSTPVGTITTTPSVMSLKIGARGNDGNARLMGQMDEVRIWSVERTQQEIKASMNRSLAGSETGLQAYYRFEETTASTIVKDLTSLTADNLGTVVGTASRVASTADIGRATPVTLTATDVKGNSTTATAFITVLDNIAPTISCPQNISVIATSAQGKVVEYSAPIGVDNCTGAITLKTTGLESGAIFPIGATVITYKVTDASALAAECSFTVKVIGERPQIVCPQNIQVNTTPNQCGANVAYTAMETVAIPVSQITYSHNSESFFSVGTTAVTATATNVIGSSQCTFNVDVLDNQNPVITCPTPLSINSDLGDCGAKATFEVTATDNCKVQVDFTSGLPSGSIFPVGVTENVYTATDASKNKTTCSFTVTVKDVENPVIKCPADVTINCQDNNTSTATGMATATDNCTLPNEMDITQAQVSTYSADPLDPSHYNYIISRKWLATDKASNSSICTQTITVQDVTKPTITTVANVIVNCQDDNSSKATGVATGQDICSPVSITQSDVSTQNTDAATAGHYNYTITRTWRATDVTGNFY